MVAKIGLECILPVSNFTRQRLKSFKVLALVSLFVKVFHVIAPLKRLEFLVKFVSGLRRMMFSFLLRPECLCKNKSSWWCNLLNTWRQTPLVALCTLFPDYPIQFVLRRLRCWCPMAAHKQSVQPLHGVSPGCLGASCCTITTLSDCT